VTGDPAAVGEGAGRLLVAEVFGDQPATFQGEGPSAGTPAVFIRLSRCNLTCTWCDTPYTWDWQRFDPHEQARWQAVEELTAWALEVPATLVVITGGEPLLQQRRLVPLVERLLASGRRVEVETNGTVAPHHALLAEGITFNVSPKLANSGVAEGQRIVPKALEAFVASGRAVFKFVARAVEELDEISVVADRFGLSPIYVMPEGTTVEELVSTTRALAEAVPARGWNLTQRLHIMAFGNVRGR
jgi:7-carboxy-7-deazaguanine synthase